MGEIIIRQPQVILLSWQRPQESVFRWRSASPWAGHPIYEPLLWMFQAVTVCPHHRQPLDSTCPVCGRMQYVFSSNLVRATVPDAKHGWDACTTRSRSIAPPSARRHRHHAGPPARPRAAHRQKNDEAHEPVCRRPQRCQPRVRRRGLRHQMANESAQSGKREDRSTSR